MKAKQQHQRQSLLESLSIGFVLLDASTLRVRYANKYVRDLLPPFWHTQDLRGRALTSFLPEETYRQILPFIEHLGQTGESVREKEILYEGMLEERGRAYWQITFERPDDQLAASLPGKIAADKLILLTIEDITVAVRTRLDLYALQQINATLVQPFALPLVLDRILQALQDMFGSRRCAIFLLDPLPEPATGNEIRHATIAAHLNIHPFSLEWHPRVDERLLLGRIRKEPRTILIRDTHVIPELSLPLLLRDGKPVRPGSVLCVPILNPGMNVSDGEQDLVLGTIEVYHARIRTFSAEEIRLLERFAQQAGLALYNTRLIRKAEELAQIASRTAYQKANIMQAIPDAIVIYDARWRIADLNLAARTIFGWDDTILGQPMHEALRLAKSHLHKWDFLTSDNPIEELERRVQDEQVDEFKMLSAEGKALALRCSYRSVSDELGNIFGFIIVYQDITDEVSERERIEAQVISRTAELAQRNQALQEAKEAQDLARLRLSLLLERLPSGVMLISASDASIQLINHQAIHLLGSLGMPLPDEDHEHVAQSMIGTSAETLFRSATLYDRDGLPVSYEEKPLGRALSKGEASEEEFHTGEIDGQLRFILFNAAPLRAPDGNLESVMLVLHDISRTKILERARENFFTAMAHELKTPLANMRAHLSALLTRDLEWSVQEQREMLENADEQVERLVGMVNHFLDASRVEAGALRLEWEAILLPELLEDLTERLEALTHNIHSSLDIHVSPQLPAIAGDYELIISVLSNLLSNAFRVAPSESQVVLHAQYEREGVNDEIVGVRLSVRDQGPGLTAEEQKKLFLRFSTFAAGARQPLASAEASGELRRRRHTRWSPGTGLGLYISRGIVEAHGSCLFVKSSPGEGTTFSFVLPLYRERGEDLPRGEETFFSSN